MAPASPKGLIDNTGQPLDRMPDDIRAGTNGILFNDRGEVLLQQRSDNGYWALPGGGIDVGESAAEGAVREVLEETGLTTAIKRLVGVYSDPRAYSVLRYPSGPIIHYVILLFEVEYVSGEIQVSEESRQVGFYSPDSFPEPLAQAARIRIADAMAGRTEAFVR